MSNILDINGLSIHFGGVRAVDNVSLSVEKGSITSIIGPNGAGKTTVFNMVSGIYKPTAGTILLDGTDITGKPQHEISWLGLARTFQNIRLYQGLTVSQNVQAVLDARAKYNVFEALLRLPSASRIDKENIRRSEEYLEIVGLAEYKKEKPSNLPYGLQRKLELARALATEPKLLLLDEPAAGLNTMEVEEFIKLIHDIRNRFEVTVLLIEHRLQVVYTLSKKVYVLSFGKLIAEGTPAEIQTNQTVIDAYMGEDE
ncbi:MAG: ABC transporter ATP-binding protein [Candidatus Pelethousia sp.]|nr:ABC transporter ATP-binding protein [Candidatus Pelethousia sp.]